MTSVSPPFPRGGGMSEHVAIVAGAGGGGLDRATAEKLAAAGFTVAGVDRSEEGLKELPDGIRREAADPTNPAAARSVVDRIAAEAGPPQVLVKPSARSARGRRSRPPPGTCGS